MERKQLCTELHFMHIASQMILPKMEQNPAIYQKILENSITGKLLFPYITIVVISTKFIYKVCARHLLDISCRFNYFIAKYIVFYK